MTTSIHAIIFDLDGVLTDTSEYHYRAWKHLADDEGIAFTREENDAHLRGVSRRESLLYLLRERQTTQEQREEMMERKNRYYNDLIRHMTPKEVVPGGVALLQEIRRAGIKLAIASASKNAMTVLQRLAIVSYFDGIADGNCVVRSKPEPDIFLFAAGLLGTPTPACLGVEDANAGVEAIKTAGMRAIGVGPRERFARADRVLDTCAQKTLADLLSV